MSEKRLLAEFKLVTKTPPHTQNPQILKLYPTDPDETFYKWTASIAKPTKADSPYYYNGQWQLDIEADSTYPIRPPKILFSKLTPINHPNINIETGEICLDILRSDGWTPAWDLQSLVGAILILLDDPEPNSPLNVDLANLLRCDPLAFESIVQYTIWKNQTLFQSQKHPSGVKPNLINAQTPISKAIDQTTLKTVDQGRHKQTLKLVPNQTLEQVRQRELVNLEQQDVASIVDGQKGVLIVEEKFLSVIVEKPKVFSDVGEQISPLIAEMQKETSAPEKKDFRAIAENNVKPAVVEEKVQPSIVENMASPVPVEERRVSSSNEQQVRPPIVQDQEEPTTLQKKTAPTVETKDPTSDICVKESDPDSKMALPGGSATLEPSAKSSNIKTATNPSDTLFFTTALKPSDTLSTSLAIGDNLKLVPNLVFASETSPFSTTASHSATEHSFERPKRRGSRRKAVAELKNRVLGKMTQGKEKVKK